MNTQTLVKVLNKLKKEYPEWVEPAITMMSRRKRGPFRVLIGTIISQRTKDEVTIEAAQRLFAVADTPRKIIKLPVRRIAALIYPSGFYNSKGKNIKDVSRTLISCFKGKVPDTIKDLLTLKGVGRKTANLVLTKGYGKQAICVDTHVHRISNRFGYVKTKKPDITEFVLRDNLPRKWWIEYNDILVAFGKTICRPVSPRCSECPVEKWCEKAGTKKTGGRKKKA